MPKAVRQQINAGLKERSHDASDALSRNFIMKLVKIEKYVVHFLHCGLRDKAETVKRAFPAIKPRLLTASSRRRYKRIVLTTQMPTLAIGGV